MDSIISTLIKKGFKDLRIEHEIRKNLIKELKTLEKLLADNELRPQNVDPMEFSLLQTLDKFLSIKFPDNPYYDLQANKALRKQLLQELEAVEKEVNPVIEFPEYPLTNAGIDKAIKKIFSKSSTIRAKNRAASFLIKLWEKGQTLPVWSNETGITE